jgi:hypothetical protein
VVIAGTGTTGATEVVAGTVEDGITMEDEDEEIVLVLVLVFEIVVVVS